MVPIDNQRIAKVLGVLAREAPAWSAPVVTEMAAFGADPYRLLIACLLSLRTKDTTTGPAARRLFAVASTPEQMLALSEQEIQKLIFPVGFYRNKAALLREVSATLLQRFGGHVPSDLDALLSIKGIGRKTANLVITAGFGLPGICVDTHVHRISNRWGYVATKTPDDTEMALRKKLPPQYWIQYNDLLVALGQTFCHPTSPKCSTCPIQPECPRVGVIKSR